MKRGRRAAGEAGERRPARRREPWGDGSRLEEKTESRTCHVRISTRSPSASSTAGLRITWSPALTPSRTSTSVPRSRATDDLAQMRATPSSTTATCTPSRLKMIAPAGTDEARRLARNVQLDGAVDAGRQARRRDWECRSRPAACACRAAGRRRCASPCRGRCGPGISGTRMTASTPGARRTPASCGTIDLRADHVALHDGEHEGAADRVGLHQAADVDVALGDDAVERRHDALIGLLLLQHLQLRLLGHDVGLGDARPRPRCALQRLDVDRALLLRSPSLP